VLGKVGLDARRVCLEITESVLMEDPGAAIETLQGLKEIGVQLAIDDFGTGSSSLSYLRRFPIDLLKVDRSFVDGLGPDPEDSAIVAAIVSLAHNLDRGVVAEGVETVEQLSELRALGCDAAQGYLFARPQPADAVTPYLHRLFAV
jgi:EAL domain-containing protein (putative c-di-GMP-specific phosphodiesterase class I)